MPLVGTLCHKCASDVTYWLKSRRSQRIKKGVKTRWRITRVLLNIFLHTWYWAKQDWWRLSPGLFDHTPGKKEIFMNISLSSYSKGPGALTLPHTNIPTSKLRQYGADSYSICTSFTGVTVPWGRVKWIARGSYCFSHASSICSQMYWLPNQRSWLLTLFSGCPCWKMQFS